eukprot:1160804-Pelagomonas_calceolata.AAC.7
MLLKACSKIFHAQSVMYANKLVSTRRAIQNNDTSYSQLCGGGDSWLFRASVSPRHKGNR